MLKDIDNLIKAAKEAEEVDNAEEASGLHRMIARLYAKIGNMVKSQIHANKAAVYDDEEDEPMRFVDYE